MSNYVIYVASDAPAGAVVGIHNLIDVVNAANSGKTPRNDFVRAIDIPASYTDGQYDTAILFKNNKISEEFYRTLAKTGISSYIAHQFRPYCPESVHVEHRGNGRLAVWTAPGNTLIHLTGEAVCQLPWVSKDASDEPVVITDVIIAGPTNHVRTINARYRYTKRHNRGGFTAVDWMFVAKGLPNCKKASHQARLYLVTDKGTIIEANPGNMSWLRPKARKPGGYYTDMQVSGYTRKELSVRNLKRATNNKLGNDNTYIDSIRNIALTNVLEALY